MYEIKNDAELPAPWRRRKFPFDRMEVGQYIEEEDPEVWESLRSNASRYGTRHGKCFTCRIHDGRLRVYRLK